MSNRPSWIDRLSDHQLGDHRGDDVIAVPCGERSVPGTIDVDDPQVRTLLVGHDVHKVPDIDDPPTIRGESADPRRTPNSKTSLS